MRLRFMLIFMFLLLLVPQALFASGNDLETHRHCLHCGMDRKLYGYSRMLIEYDDGTTVGSCSLHCTLTEMDQKRDKKIARILVADRRSRILVDATNAYWTIGGSRRGVMTSRAKWAFGKREDALAFMDENGGTLATWEEALDAARKDHEQLSRTRR